MVKNHNRYRREDQSETEVKEREKKLLEFITIETINVEQQKFPEQDIIPLPVYPIINSF